MNRFRILGTKGAQNQGQCAESLFITKPKHCLASPQKKCYNNSAISFICAPLWGNPAALCATNTEGGFLFIVNQIEP